MASQPNFDRCDVCKQFHAEGFCAGPIADPAQATIEERNSTHGDYEVQATLSQALKTLLRRQTGWDNLSIEQRETLDMLCVKMSRVLCGDPNEPDHWLDMMGYVKLVHNQLLKGKTV